MGAGEGFWEMLKPVCHRSEDLSLLRGKRLAVDLSFWIVQQDAAIKDRARKPHLRLTFFRVVHLVAKVGALPIFVVDGEAPALKMGARIERFSRISGIMTDGSQLESYGPRNAEFLEKVEECVKLLNLLGVPVLRAKGEAEALCAELERKGVVDACVTPDSDAFLHGANWVIQTLQDDWRNPLMVSYKATEIKSALRLSREHLIALALLVGCDYNTRGVPGIGYAKAVPLVQQFPENQVLDQLRQWGKGEYPSQEQIERMSNGEESIESVQKYIFHCSKCGHPGTKRLHINEKCKLCAAASVSDSTNGCRDKTKDFKCTCDNCQNKAKKKKSASKVNWWSKIRAKISATSNFPNEKIIQLFLSDSELAGTEGEMCLSQLKWEAPKMNLIRPFLAHHLHWDEDYIRQKTLPLLSHFCLLNSTSPSSSSSAATAMLINGKYAPHSIQRIQIQRSTPFYLLNWKSIEQEESCFTTQEDISLVKRACPHLVQQFEELQTTKKKATRRKKKEVTTPTKPITTYFKPAVDDIIHIEDSESEEESKRNLVKRRLF